MKENLLVLLGQTVGRVRSADIMLNAAGRIPEEEPLETLRRRGFVDRSIVETLLVQINVPRRSAKDGLNDFFARFNASPDLLGEQAQSVELPKGVVGQRLFPSAQRLHALRSQRSEIRQLLVDLT